MSTAIQRADAAQAAHSLTREQIQILKDTVAKGTTDAELAFFLQVCKAKGLDPFSGQIHAMKRRTKNRQTDAWEERLTWQTGIDGFRTQAERTGERDGMDPPEWCGDDGAWLDVWLKKEPPRACRVRVYRKNISRPYQGTANWDFYVQTWKDSKGAVHPNEIWAKGGPHMLAKCAEALALRIAFPLELGDLVTHDEMAAQVADAMTFAAPTPPTVGQVIDLTEPTRQIVAATAAPGSFAQLGAEVGIAIPSAASPTPSSNRGIPASAAASDPRDLAARLLAARNDADLAAIVPELNALPKSPEKSELRALYGDVKKALAKKQAAPPATERKCRSGWHAPECPGDLPTCTADYVAAEGARMAKEKAAGEPYDGPPEDVEPEKQP